MTETHISSTEFRDCMAHIVKAATWDDTRFVVTWYGVEMAAMVGIADLSYLRDRDRELLRRPRQARDAESSPPEPPPAPPPESQESLKERARQGDWQAPRTKDAFEIAIENCAARFRA
jgi:hypothetical protein